MATSASSSGSKSTGAGFLEYQINHVFLPPKLPQEDDMDIRQENLLVSSLLESTRDFSRECSPSESLHLGRVIGMLEQLLKMKPGLDSSTKESVMQEAIEELSEGEHLLFHVRAQNAGLLLTCQEDHVVVEAFELSAQNKDVMSCQGRLVRHFPDSAAVVDRKTMQDPNLLGEFVKVLRVLELQASPLARPKSRKAGQDFEEDRDTDSPLLVTGMLVGTLAGIGQSVEPQQICKRSREQTSWHSARLPFHRSPTWLLLRVALRLVLDRAESRDRDVSVYKALIAFHHGRLLGQAATSGLNSELRFCMAAKLLRRLVKLKPPEDAPWVQQMRQILTTNDDDLQARWEQTQDGLVTHQMGRLKLLSFEADTNLSLKELSPHLSWIRSRSEDTPLEANRSLFSRWSPGLSQTSPPGHAYAGNPEALSVMYLSVMELWVAMDTIAGKAIPLLLDYDPGFTLDFLHRLILPTRTQVARLQRIEHYLSSRRKAAATNYPPMFSGVGEPGSFAVRYFDSSRTHQALLDRIKTRAEEDMRRKILEYRGKLHRHGELTRQRAQTDHEEEQRRNGRRYMMVCKPACSACSIDRDITRLTIDLLEWPLPDNLGLAKAVVFEIHVPRAVAIWRNVTAKLFLDILPDPNRPEGKNKIWYASSRSGLKPFATSMSRIQLASPAKPVEASHYKAKHITAVIEQDLCACLEAGPSSSDGSVAREAHADLLSPEFVDRMVTALNDTLTRLRANWQNQTAVSLLICLATRILSFTASGALVDSLLGFLSRARSVTIQWARQLLQTRASCSTAERRKELSERVLMAALSCLATYNIQPSLLEKVLGSEDGLAVFVEAAILAHDHTPATGRMPNSILNILSHRWRTTMHRALDFVKGEVVAGENSGFHAAIQRFWADYSPSTTQWAAQWGSRGHILRGKMRPANSNANMDPTDISFNLLHGRLLVNGYPLSRLPDKFVSHRTYGQLFGSQVLEVMPSTRKGMQFSACREQQGWVVHFAMVDSELVIQALRRQDPDCPEDCSALFEFIPPWKLGSDVPNSFKRGYSHWLDISKGIIEFRPLGEPWVRSSDNWLLERRGGCNTLTRNGCFLIDPHSPTAEAVSTFLSPIESIDNVDIIYHPEKHTAVIDLPRFSLSFTLLEGESMIRSKHYSGMRIDECQRIGALVGLQNKLVLKQDGIPECCTPLRIVLVPRGPLKSRILSHHVSVEVACNPGELHVKHDAFTIDPLLGQIRTTGSLSSRLYLCRLHALTSHCLPDPLTGRTGTEEALRILRSASVRSFQRLDPESYNQLRGLASLSPQRLYYPERKDLQEMERVLWAHDLPVLSQNDEFEPAAEYLLEHARDCEILHRSDEASAGTLDLRPLNRSCSVLVNRAKVRNAMLKVSEFGAEDYTTSFDHSYLGRHRGREGQDPTLFTRVKAVTSSVVSGGRYLLDRPSATLRQDILEFIGKSFDGEPDVDITFSIDHLRPRSTELGRLWCSLHRALAEETNKYKVSFFLSALVYAEEADWDIVQALMAIANARDKFGTEITPPRAQRFELDTNISSLHSIVEGIIAQYRLGFSSCPEAGLPRLPDESMKAAKQRRYNTWQSQSTKMATEFSRALEWQWQREPRTWKVTMPTGRTYGSYLDVNAIMREVAEALKLARRTALFETYLDKLVTELGRMKRLPSETAPRDAPSPCITAPLSKQKQTSGLGYVEARSLFRRSAPQTQRPEPANFSYLWEELTQVTEDNNPLADLLDRLSVLCGNGPYRAAYLEELRSSSGSTASPRYRLKKAPNRLKRALEKYLRKCRLASEEIRSCIDNALRGHSLTDTLCQAAGLYPRISNIFLLERLSRAFWKDLSPEWRECLVNYGLSLAYLQQAERLVAASRRADRQTDLLKELLNTGSHGCQEGDPLSFPESLLLELEQGILIRPVQQSIAAKMREPPGGHNSVMQLNMGEGKSSVIVPIVAAALADGQRLVRVVVAKPQLKQMMHTLTAALGGLVNRQIFYLPISRAVRLTSSDVTAVQRMLDRCKTEGGVLLVQPEHLLSFKLMGLERIWTDGGRDSSTANQILETYRKFEDDSRDIVDESDEIFSVKHELIFTLGLQQPVDMSPDRWTLIQELMDILLEVAKGLVDEDTKSGRARGLLFEEDKASGRFPTVRVLEEAAGRRLVGAIAGRVCRTGLRGFPIQHQSKQMREAVLQYILEPNLTPQQIAAVQSASNGCFNDAHMKNAILLLRGLLASGVILFALGQKRFRVNYGLAPDRVPPTMLAVPYRAKDSPAPRSEFSHPDIVIVLTCLSYYYQGLSDSELRTCLEKLDKSDQAEEEYSRWAAASPLLPASLRHFSGVNLEDSTLCRRSVFPALRFAKPAIDYYLSNVVFPMEMREFPWKLSASGWDLGKRTRHPLTGFSGTTDSKYVLPLSVKALDLPEQRHTNSAVLACLLRPENTVLELGGNQPHLSALTVDMLLTAVTTSPQPMRVILDVGAQIIELSNLQVAERWLGMVPVHEADAVIYFNAQDELSANRFFSTGCMRMRKLGNGQSVTFCVSPEMKKRIRTFGRIQGARKLTVADILVCAIAETWDDAHRSLPLWATQGLRHQHQEVVWKRVDACGVLSNKDVGKYLEEEAQSLEQRYRPVLGTGETSNAQSLTARLNAAQGLKSRQDQVALIRQKCVEFGLAELDAMGSLQEEQERELAPEVERERQVERPRARDPATHHLHPDVQNFAMSGILAANSKAFVPAFQTLSGTSAAKLFPLAEFPSSLLATADFARTIEPARHDAAAHTDAYQRPVQWLLTQHTPLARHGMRLVLISSFEANALKPLLATPLPTATCTTNSCNHPQVYLRAYLPRSNPSLPSLEGLTTYTIPSNPAPPPPPHQLVTQLNLFAGQLYLASHASYLRLCWYLGLAHAANESDDRAVAADGFVGRRRRADGGGAGAAGYEEEEEEEEGCEFATSPVGFLAVLLRRVRRDCVGVERSHLGRVLAGEVLTRRDFEGVVGAREEEGVEEVMEEDDVEMRDV
ncbi:uncharacterized protein THITE_2145549 [Thermothielavioides terrestris NRRL 8126]|uniref:ubiquitinyl hydrolase 1 n=1 Tax=Thermothielavioides terrestris (strain ATCC 38088 / NRRL 8126) TaxID=578455 RepID=G2R5Z3_THETT|nr:uncharacterized protein THITE_2145549 [Thermothielavioides terrestris NRRL 8126]AEO68380.1 hypothetical protein THITE_2145549 [Thermothielavioides terrestris NRRL 8126]